MIMSFFRTIARRASKGLNLAPTQMIISYPPDTSLTRQRSFDFTDPDDHLNFHKTIARRASQGHSNARKSPTVPQTQVIISFLSPFILSILLISSKFSCPT